MREIKTIKAMRREIEAIRKNGKRIGFVPTMGYLHEGHAKLMRSSTSENDVTILSIFVNRLQFGKNEDFSSYPRDLKKDKIFAKKENIDIILHPSENEMYPEEQLTHIDVDEITNGLCGRFRPGHFRGVATVVAKLLNIVTPDVMYLGQKDAQQVAVLKKMVSDLNMPVIVKSIPTVREKDGLALSSRNAYLSAEHRRQAVVLYQSLVWAKQEILAGERNPVYLTKKIKSMVETNSQGKIQYVECVDAERLTPLKDMKGKVLVAIAGFFGSTRLIDNIVVDVR